MDDVKVIVSKSFINKKFTFTTNQIQNIDEIYLYKLLEMKYLNKMIANIYCTAIEDISYNPNIYQHPNDSTFIVEIQYAICGIKYYNGMQIAFSTDNVIKVNEQIYLKKNNVIALVNDLPPLTQRQIIIAQVSKDPEFIPNADKQIEIGLICTFVKLIEYDDETAQFL